MFVLGTAGHVDHGKSTLVRALTGIDPDRLQEEKERGMTIDLGFAWFALSDGREVSIVDVPGHERFIKNMLAGVGGIDLALLVIAADEGVMPQTREHLAILDLLGVTNGVLVLTKSDLVDDEWLDLVASESEELVEGTALEGAPLVRCSAATGAGIDELKAVIEGQLRLATPKRDLGRPRISIDRVFTVSGFGTVVTGTLVDGVLSTGQEVEIVPAVIGGHVTSRRSRVRGLQSHRSKVEAVDPGTRTAANLANVEPDELSRGQVVTTPGWLQPSIAVDVRLRALASAKRPLRHNLNINFHSLAAEAPARLRLLELDELSPGEEAWAQIRLLQPLAVVKGDRFIIRDANDTLGGGVIIETQARRHPRRRPGVIAALEQQQTGDPAELMYATIAAHEPAGLRAALARVDLHPAQAEAAIQRLATDARIIVLGDGDRRIAYTAPGYERVRATITSLVGEYHRQNPGRRGILKEELRSRLGLPPRLFGDLLEAAASDGDLTDAAGVVALAAWQPSLSPQQLAEANAYVSALQVSPYAPQVDHRPDAGVVAYLADSGLIVQCGGDTVFTAAAFEEMTNRVVALATEKGSITIADVRDLLGSSRRFVQPFLEELDRRNFTLRRGDERILRGQSRE